MITGRVQGVWFRANTKQEAEKRGIHGWVRNTPDGKVEAMFQGPRKHVEEMIQWCQKGPSLSRVEHVETTIVEDQVPYDAFTIRY